MKVRFIAENVSCEFKVGDILEARHPKGISHGKLYAITNRFGEHYGYPASWFEVVAEDDPKENGDGLI